MCEHLVNLEQDIRLPNYAANSSLLDLSFIVLNATGAGPTGDIDIFEESSTPEPTRLDKSQLRALENMLSKRLAIVQGPPGTGKTHVSTIALKILLSRMVDDDPPLIIASQTNHALDQLLSHVAKFEPNFVRLGGRTVDPDVQKHTLFEIRQKQKSPNVSGGLRGQGMAGLKRHEKKMVAILSAIHEQTGPFSAFLMRDLRLLSESQYKSLEDGASNSVQAFGDRKPTDCVAKWMGDDLLHFNNHWHTDDAGFEFEEADLEFEQLKELEAESKCANAEEEADWLSGRYISITEPYTAQRYPNVAQRQIDQALQQQDMWAISPELRRAIYVDLQGRVKQRIQKAFQREAKEYYQAAQKVKIGRWETDSAVLKKAKVVGLTTTGLSKYRALIASLRPRVVLIEEAAEVLEGQIATGCVESLEHLILVGDHKQLRAHCSVMELEGEPYNLGVSMFERLIRNGIEYSPLQRQRRMIPEIRRLLAPIYGNLDDHASVLGRADVPGMSGINSFFFAHSWPESFDDLSSRRNDMEAEMTVGLYRHLVLNGMRPEDITVLTFYNGQRKLLLKKLKQQPGLSGRFFTVKTVDSYQGEENEIVLLSLVRSNDKRNIGFLSIENRVCVALSRARRGFYIFGNALNLCLASELWWQVIKIMSERPRRVGSSLPLRCSKHGLLSWINDPRQWGSISGGCQHPCEDMLPCGHPCILKCHR